MKYIVKVLALNAGKNIFRSGEEVEGHVFGTEKLSKLIKGGYLTPVEVEGDIEPVKTPAKTKAEIAAEKKAAEKAEKERLKAEAEAEALAAESTEDDNENEFKSHSEGAINLKDNDL